MSADHHAGLRDWLLIKASLPLSEGEILAYIEAWKVLLGKPKVGDTAEDTVDLQRALFSHLYENLNILDAKTNSLLQLSSILVAAYVFVSTSANLQIPNAEAPLFFVGLGYAVAAMFCCLVVIWVHWSSQHDLRNSDSHVHHLVEVRTRRTIVFRRAWSFSAGSICAIIALLVNKYSLSDHLNFTTAILIIVAGHIFLIFLYDDILYLGWIRE